MPRLPWQRENWHVASWLSAVCFAFFLLSYQDPEAFRHAFAFDPARSLPEGRLWQLLTYPFFFGSPLGFFFTVLLFMITGTALEALWGSVQFLIFLVISILGASSMAAIVGVPLAGPSGLDFNLLVAFAAHFPETVFMLWLVVPVKVKWLAWISAVVLLATSAAAGPSGLVMMAGTSSGLIYWALRLRAGRALRSTALKVKAVSSALVPSKDQRQEALRVVDELRLLAAPGGAGTVADAVARYRARVTPLVNVCPPDYFEPSAEHCAACNGFLECALRAAGLGELPARKPGGVTASGAADALAAHASRERDAQRRARMAPPGQAAAERS